MGSFQPVSALLLHPGRPSAQHIAASIWFAPAHCRHFPNGVLPPETVLYTQAAGIGLCLLSSVINPERCVEPSLTPLQPFCLPSCSLQIYIISATLVGRWGPSASLRPSIRSERMSLGPLTSRKETFPVCRSVLATGSLLGEAGVLSRRQTEGIGVVLSCCGVSTECFWWDPVEIPLGCEEGKGFRSELVGTLCQGCVRLWEQALC